jgi:hypothetical protein
MTSPNPTNGEAEPRTRSSSFVAVFLRFDRRLRTAIASVVVVGGIETILAFFVADARTALAVGLGAALAVGNLVALALVVTSLLPSGEAASRGQAAWTLLALIKMLVLFGVTWLLLRSGVISPLALLVGFGALPLGIAIGSLVSDRKGLETAPSGPPGP